MSLILMLSQEIEFGSCAIANGSTLSSLIVVINFQLELSYI